MAAATIAGFARNAAPEPVRVDGVLVALAACADMLDRPVTDAELRAAATVPEAGADLRWL